MSTIFSLLSVGLLSVPLLSVGCIFAGFSSTSSFANCLLIFQWYYVSASMRHIKPFYCSRVQCACVCACRCVCTRMGVCACVCAYVCMQASFFFVVSKQISCFHVWVLSYFNYNNRLKVLHIFNFEASNWFFLFLNFVLPIFLMMYLPAPSSKRLFF